MTTTRCRRYCNACELERGPADNGGFCDECWETFCEECLHDVRDLGIYLCDACLSKAREAQVARASAEWRANP